MGVPKFYRWVSERYPCLSEVVKEFQLPEFDNLYLDMNGIVHVCSHPEDDNPHFRITEEQIFKDICHYIEFLFRMIKPRKMFFMAIDGVAPRAKMNQQRGRRFRSAREAEELIKRAQEKGEVLPTEKRFDSNCITPGTFFMKRLQDHLKYFVVSKVTHDPLWQGPKIILSGQETPGEGEHKIMDYIRYSRSQPDHDPNTRHCLYGLDADLIMLGLASHEPHFALLREEVRFGGHKDRNRRPTTPEETTFHLLHLSLMREYLDYEFSELREKLSFTYDVEKVIDDWILMGFLVGNDFIPHLPHLHIHHDALPLLWKTYMEVLPTLDGYLNEGGHLNLKRFEKYIGALAKFDREQFSEQYVDMKYLEGKREARLQDCKTNGASPARKTLKAKDDNSFAVLANMQNVEEEDVEEFLCTLDKKPAHAADDDDDDEEDEFDTFDAEFKAHKRDYYMTKLEFDNVTPEVLKSQAFEYVRAIQWILLYYYEGCQSWSWFYPHHYAPYISDVKDFSDMEITFDMSEPFRPFEQLMSVLPSASKELLPECLQELMTEETSPVIGYYPVNFQTDLNGKQQEWEAVVLIPFIDEEKLLSAIRSKEQYLTPEERQRNSHGPCYMYQYSPEHQGAYPSPMPAAFPDVAASHAKVVEIPKFHFCLPPVKIRKGLLPGTMLDVYFPGFPTLKHIPHTHCLDKCQVKVFQHNSRGFNMILTITDQPEKPLEDIASELLGSETWVGWPHLHEAKVFAIANEKFRIEIEEVRVKGQRAPTVQWKRKPLSKAELDEIYKDASAVREKYMDRFGVNIGKTAAVIYAGAMTGRKYVYTSHGQITIEKQFSSNLRTFALQTTCKNVLCHAPDDMSLRTLEELFPVGGAVFMLGHPHYGCQGEVLEVDRKEGRVRANFSILQEPDFTSVYFGQQVENEQYMPSYIAAQRLGIMTRLLTRITGTVLILRGAGGNTDSKANIGLNLKFTKRGEEKPGYTRKTDDGWLYSDKCVQVIGDYLQKFPDLWDYIATSATGGSDVYTEAELFPPEETEVSLGDVLKYLEELPCAKVTTMKTGADIVGDITIKALEEAVEKAMEQNKKTQKKVKIFAKAHVLFRPLPNQGGLEPDPGTQFEMLDRVVVVKMGYSVPLGLRGTVVGIHPGETPADTLFDVIFDQDFTGGISIRCSSKRGYRVPAIAMLNLSYGQRKLERQHPQPRAAPAAWQQPLAPQLQQPSAHWQQQPQHSPAGNRQGQGSYSGLMGQEWRRAGYNTMSPRQQNQQAGGYACPPPQQPPQFVTPRLASLPAKPVARVSPHRGPVPSALPPSDTNDFTNIWNQLITSNASAGPLPKMPVTLTGTGDSPPLKILHPAAEKSAAASPIKTEAAAARIGPLQLSAQTLDSAAQKLSRVALPSSKNIAALPSSKDLIDLSSKPEVPVDVLVDLTEASSHWLLEDQAQPVGCAAPLKAKSQTPPASVKQKSREEKGRTPSRDKESSKRAGVRIITNSNLALDGEKQKVEKPSSNKIVDLFEKASRVHSGLSKSVQQSQPLSQGHDLNVQEKSQSPVISSDKVQGAGSSAVSSEFNSMFAALQMVSKSATGEPDKAESGGVEASTSAALKQLLKIGMNEEEKQEATGECRRSYGRQVSVQELFEGAKQVPVPSPLVSAKSAAAVPVSAPPQQPPVPQQHQPGSLPQQHRSQLPVNQPLLPLPSLLGAPPSNIQARNPVDDLRYICQLSGQGGPKFDFSYQPKQKGFIASVHIPGGARFEGSVSQTKEDAAESAASMALLCLRQVGGTCPPWLLQPGPGMSMLRPGQRLFSPNSAFSPVLNQLPRSFGQPIFSRPPPNIFLSAMQRGSTPLISQLPPPLSSIPLQVPPGVQQFPSHMPTAQQTGDPQSTGHTNKEPGTILVTTSPVADGEKRASAMTKSSTEAFIPMQVTRKQRRKDENVEKVAANVSSTSTHLPPSADRQNSSTFSTGLSAPTPSQDSANATVPLANSDLSTRDFNTALNTSPLPQTRPENKEHGETVNTALNTSPLPQTRPANKEHGETAGKMLAKEGPGDSERGSGKKRRPRIAANFGQQSH